MSLENFIRAAQLIEELGDGDFEGEKEVELISKAEVALGSSFPPSYKAFLKHFGCGDIGGFEVYGVVSDNFAASGIPDAVWLTLKQRAEVNLPVELVVVSEDGQGGFFALDTSQRRSDGECCVVVWNPFQRAKTTFSKDFGTFLLERLTK